MIGALVGVLVFFLLFLLAGLQGSSSPVSAPASGDSVSNDDLSGQGGNVAVVDPNVQTFAGAIAFAEGYWDANGNILVNNRPAKNNNPGDFLGVGDAGSDGLYAVYSTSQAGWNRLYQQLQLIVNGKSRYYNLGMTIEQMAQVWTATQQEAWASNVAFFLGVPVTETLGAWLTP